MIQSATPKTIAGGIHQGGDLELHSGLGHPLCTIDVRRPQKPWIGITVGENRRAVEHGIKGMSLKNFLQGMRVTYVNLIGLEVDAGIGIGKQVNTDALNTGIEQRSFQDSTEESGSTGNESGVQAVTDKFWIEILLKDLLRKALSAIVGLVRAVTKVMMGS